MTTHLYPHLWGAEGEDPPAETPAEPTEDSTPSTRELTDDELNAMTARAADRASRSATKKLASELGFDKISQLKEYVESTQAAAQEAQTDEEKRLAAIAEKEKLIAERDAASLETARQASLQLAITETGVTDPKKAKRLLTLVQAEVDADYGDEGWDESVTTAIGTLQEDWPELFDTPPSSHGSGDGGTSGPSSEDTDEEEVRMKQWEEEHRNKGRVVQDLSSMVSRRSS